MLYHWGHKVYFCHVAEKNGNYSGNKALHTTNIANSIIPIVSIVASLRLVVVSPQKNFKKRITRSKLGLIIINSSYSCSILWWINTSIVCNNNVSDEIVHHLEWWGIKKFKVLFVYKSLNYLIVVTLIYILVNIHKLKERKLEELVNLILWLTLLLCAIDTGVNLELKILENWSEIVSCQIARILG